MDEAVREAVDRLWDEDKRQNRRIDLFEESIKSIQDLTISVHELAHDMKQMLEEQKEQGERLDKLEQEPADTWHHMKVKAIDTVIGIVVGGLATGLIVMAAQYIK